MLNGGREKFSERKGIHTMVSYKECLTVKCNIMVSLEILIFAHAFKRQIIIHYC